MCNDSKKKNIYTYARPYFSMLVIMYKRNKLEYNVQLSLTSNNLQHGHKMDTTNCCDI